MIVLAISLLFTLVDRRQLLQALLCARVRASRASEGECVHCSVLCCNVACACADLTACGIAARRKGTARAAM